MTKKRNTNTLKSFGKNLALLRKEAGMTQIELEEKAELSEATIGRTERGASNPTLSTLIAIAKALGIPAKNLLDY
jgi:transcriptional regulator with XRE-family HTH domain